MGQLLLFALNLMMLCSIHQADSWLGIVTAGLIWTELLPGEEESYFQRQIDALAREITAHGVKLFPREMLPPGLKEIEAEVVWTNEDKTAAPAPTPAPTPTATPATARQSQAEILAAKVEVRGE